MLSSNGGYKHTKLFESVLNLASLRSAEFEDCEVQRLRSLQLKNERFQVFEGYFLSSEGYKFPLDFVY